MVFLWGSVDITVFFSYVCDEGVRGCMLIGSDASRSAKFCIQVLTQYFAFVFFKALVVLLKSIVV